MAEDEGGSGFIKSGAGNLAGISPGAMYLGALVAQAGAAQYLKWPEGCWLASRGQVGTSEREEGGKEETLDWDGGDSSPKAHPSGQHLGIWVWDRHLGPTRLGHWDLSAGPVPRSRNQWASRGPGSKNPGSVLPFPGEAWSWRRVRGSLPRATLLTGTCQGALGWEGRGPACRLPAWVSFCRTHGI